MYGTIRSIQGAANILPYFFSHNFFILRYFDEIFFYSIAETMGKRMVPNLYGSVHLNVAKNVLDCKVDFSCFSHGLYS